MFDRILQLISFVDRRVADVVTALEFSFVVVLLLCKFQKCACLLFLKKNPHLSHSMFYGILQLIGFVYSLADLARISQHRSLGYRICVESQIS